MWSYDVVKKMDALLEYLSLQNLLIFVVVTFVFGILSVSSDYMHVFKLETGILCDKRSLEIIDR